MSVKTYHDKQNHILIQEFTGHLNTDDFLDAQKAGRLKARNHKIRILWDNRKADTTDLTYNQMKYLAQNAHSLWQNQGPLRTAILVQNPVEFGMARMYQSLAGGNEQEIEIFDDISTACIG